MSKKKFDKLILIFIILQPFLDILTSMCVRNGISISLGIIIRGIFFLCALLYLINVKFNFKFILMFLMYVFLSMLYFIFETKSNYLLELINIIKIFYLPILIMFFERSNNKKINDKLILLLYFIYMSLIIIPYIFNLGFNIYKPYEHKNGYIGFFYSANEISSIIVIMMPIVFNYLIKSNNYLLKIFIFVETIITTLLIGTKTLLLGLIIVTSYFIIKYLKINFKRLSSKNKKVVVGILILLVFLTIYFFPSTGVKKNLDVALNYYKIDNVSDMTKIENIDNIIFSKRLTFLNDVNKMYFSSDKLTYIYGLGLDRILKLKDVEIDIFDLFYSIGVFGFLIYFVIMKKALSVKLHSYYHVSFVLAFFISLVSGHVLLEPAVAIYISLILILERNNRADRNKSILLVSNMYPSKKYKYFGSFVKNTEKLLIDNGFNVDKVVKTKETNKIIKLFSYLHFYLKTTLYGIVNNYDYIYVHFISHSTFGTILPLLTSKNTKLILNAHGNDIVKDYDFEEKNIKRSRLYLKYAYKVISPSNYFKDVLINDFNVDESKIVVYPSGGVDTSFFKKIDKEEAKDKCNLKKEYKYIGYVGRIEKDKGYDTFVKSAIELKKNNQIGDYRFLIIGSGSLENELRDLINKNDLIKYFEIRNMVSQEELLYIYNSLDLFIFPTYRKSESLGLVGLEAMACERIVIASDNYGPKDYIISGKNGFSFKPNNEEDLKNKIINCEKLNQEQIKKIGKKARETAIKYDNKNTEEIIINVFKEN